MRVIHLAGFMLAALVCAAGFSQTTAPTAGTFILPHSGVEFAVDPATGNLATILPSQAMLRVYSAFAARHGEGEIDVKIGETPCGLACKKIGNAEKFLVLCAGDRSLYEIDAANPAVTTTIQLGDDIPLRLAVAADAPVAFYTTQSRTLGQVDLKTGKDLGPVMPAETGPTIGFDQIAASPDGHLIYSFTQRPDQSGNGTTLWMLSGDTATPNLTRLAYARNGTGVPVIDPNGQFVALGLNLFDPQMDHHDQLRSAPLLFLKDRPLMLASNGPQLEAISADTLKPVANFKIPDWQNRGNQNKPVQQEVGDEVRQFKRAILEDPQSQSFLVAERSRIAVIPESVLNLPDEPFLSVDVSGNRTANVGQSTVLTLKRRDANSTLQLADSNKDFKLDGDQLTWTPSTGGATTAMLRISDGSLQRDVELRLEAEIPHVTFNFTPTFLSVSPSGKLAVAVFKPTHDNEPENYHGPVPLAVADLTTNTIIARTIVNEGIGVCAIDDQHVYFSPDQTNVIVSMDVPSLARTARVFAPRRVFAMDVMGGRNLWAECADVGLPNTEGVVYSLPDLKTESAPQLRLDADTDDPPRQRLYPVGDDWYRDGVLYGPDGLTPLMFTDPGRMLRIHQGEQEQPYDGGGDAPALGPWGARIFNNQLVRGGQNLDLGTTGGCVLADIPAVLTGETESPAAADPNYSDVQKYVVKVHDLITGAVVQRIVLADVDRVPLSETAYALSTAPRIVRRPGVALVQVFNRLYTLPTAHMGEGKLQTPVYFPLKQPTLTLDSPGEDIIPFRAAGGTGTIQYSLDGQANWLSIDKDTGDVTIDHDAAIDAAVTQIALPYSNRNWGASTRPSDIDSNLQDLAHRFGPRYRQLAGKPPVGIPVAVMVRVIATDSQQMTAETTQGFLLDVPISPALQKINETIASAPTEPSGPMHIGGFGNRLSTDQNINYLQNQIADLKEKNAALQSEIDALKAGESSQQPTTQP